MKILIVTETIAGKGHEKAAVSIKQAIDKLGIAKGMSIETNVVSLLSIVNQPLERLIRYIYMMMIGKLPWLWKWMYRRESGFAWLFRDLIAWFLLIRIRGFIEREKPDLIIATHATGLTALSKLKSRNSFLLAAVFTDFQINNFWIHKEIDYYFVGHEGYKQELIKDYKIPSRKIYVSGIPIADSFSKGAGSTNRYEQYLKAKKEGFNILIMGGGLGLGGIKEVILALNQLQNLPIHLTVVTGTNQHLFHEIAKLRNNPLHIKLRVYSYVSDIYSLMNQANLLISKPGGLTTSEALAIQLPLIIYKPIPGQEEKNTAFLMQNKAAIKTGSIDEVKVWVERLFNNPNEYQQLIINQKSISYPNSSRFIADIMLGKLESVEEMNSDMTQSMR